MHIRVCVGDSVNWKQARSREGGGVGDPPPDTPRARLAVQAYTERWNLRALRLKPTLMQIYITLVGYELRLVNI